MQTGKLGIGSVRRALGLLSVVVVTAGIVAGPSAATESEASAEQAAFDEVRSRRAWTAWSDSRPVSPFFGIPFEFTFGAPFARSFMDSTPGRSEGFAGAYYADDTIEETYEASGYKNHTLARSNFPDTGRGTTSKWELSGTDGPRASTNTPSRTEAFAEARNGYKSGDNVFAPGGWSATHSVYDRKETIVNEASGAASNVRLGDAGSIGMIQSYVKVEHTYGAEPKVTYRISLSGLEAGGQKLAGFDVEGITLAGTGVAGPELAEQFNAQIAENGSALEEAVAKLSLRLVAPTVDKHDDGGYLITGPVATFRSDNTFRDNQAGDNVGIRLGYMRSYSYIIDVQG